MKKTKIKYIKKCVYIFIATLLTLSNISISRAEVAILKNISVVDTSYEWRDSWDDASNDIISLPLTGLFKFTVNEGTLNPWTGGLLKDTIILENLNVSPMTSSGREWFFPVFEGVIENGEFFGSEDPCFNRPWPGSCLSQGDFGWFNGELQDNMIVINGGKEHMYGSSLPNNYYYSIEAVIIQEGDMNLDGNITIADAIIGLKLLTGERVQVSEFYKHVSSVKLNLNGIIEILKHLHVQN